MIAALLLAAVLARPDSAARARSESEAAAMLSRLWGTQRATVLALDRDRSADGEERRTVRDSATVDEAWLTRLHALIQGAPAMACERVPLVAGQRYAYLFAIEPLLPGERSTLELDFRGPCIRMIRGGGIVAGRSLRGREARAVALLESVLRRDRALRQLAARYTVSIEAPATPVMATPDAAADSARDLDVGPRPDRDAVIAVDSPASVRSSMSPSYPEDARSRGIQGVVFVRVLVGRSGKVLDAFVQKSVPGLDVAAIQAVLDWRFQPARRNGQPVMTWITVPVKFALH